MISIKIIAQQNLCDGAIRSFLDEHETEWHQTSGVFEQEQLCEFAGRVCYMSFGEKQFRKSNGDYLKNIITQGHESVLEHAVWTLLIQGISRACSHQLVRHRVGWAFSQLSQQYHEESSKFVLPDEVRDNVKIAALWKKAINEAYDAYVSILRQLEEEGAIDASYSKREKLRLIRTAARSVLPNAMETKIVATVNARALRHFLDVRGSIDGDREMRELACALFEAVQPTSPNLFYDFSVHKLADGHRAIKKSKQE